MKKLILVLVIGFLSSTASGQDIPAQIAQIDSIYWAKEDSTKWHYELKLLWCQEEECPTLLNEWRKAIFSLRMQRLRAIRKLLGLPE